VFEESAKGSLNVIYTNSRRQSKWIVKSADLFLCFTQLNLNLKATIENEADVNAKR